MRIIKIVLGMQRSSLCLWPQCQTWSRSDFVGVIPQRRHVAFPSKVIFTLFGTRVHTSVRISRYSAHLLAQRKAYRWFGIH
jgi:hypothetical protein